MPIYPWQNRQSLISTEVETFSANGTATHGNLNTLLLQNNLTTQVHPLLVSRACRLTRFSFRLVHSTATAVTVTFGIQTASNPGNCSPSFVDFTSQEFSATAETPLCICSEFAISVLLNKCELWRPFMTFSPSALRPKLRLRIDMEMR